MELIQSMKPASCVRNINVKIDELPKANPLQTGHNNYSSENVAVEKSIEIVSIKTADVTSVGMGDERNKEIFDEDKSYYETIQLEEKKIAVNTLRKPETLKIEFIGSMRPASCVRHINGKIDELPNANPLQAGHNNYSSENVEVEKSIETVSFETADDTSVGMGDERNKGIFDEDKSSTSYVCYKKQTLEEEKDCLHCIAPNGNLDVKLKASHEDQTLNNVDLNDILRGEGKTSPKLKEECIKICKVIKNTSEDIVHVEAAYKKEEDKKVIFLVFAEVEIKNQTKWETEIKIINKYSDESRAVLLFEKEKKIQLTEKDSRQIGEIIDKHSKKLMTDNKFLSAISASSVVSKQFGTKNHIIEESPCIVLTVLVKGIIPLDEKPFPIELDGIPVDVREGGVRLCGQNADEYQTNVKMGCKIASSSCPKSGTLGGFVEHPEYGLCGITCAHVVVDDNSLIFLKEKTTLTEKDFNATIYQPDYIPKRNEGEQGPDYEVGKLVRVTYKEGENDKPGVDLALFKIEKRAPTNGGFPDRQISSFKTGLVWGKPGIPSSYKDVQKFGQVTGNTQGVIQFDNCVVKEIQFHREIEPENTPKLTSTLFKQYHIKSSDGFCKAGDSGALVFMKDNTGGEPDLRCIGMVVGTDSSDNSGIVTPITAILDELKVQQLKPFIINDKLDLIDKKLDTNFNQINERFNEIDKRFRDFDDHRSGSKNPNGNNV